MLLWNQLVTWAHKIEQGLNRSNNSSDGNTGSAAKHACCSETSLKCTALACSIWQSLNSVGQAVI